jgi:hypothetical protein
MIGSMAFLFYYFVMFFLGCPDLWEAFDAGALNRAGKSKLYMNLKVIANHVPL